MKSPVLALLLVAACASHAAAQPNEPPPHSSTLKLGPVVSTADGDRTFYYYVPTATGGAKGYDASQGMIIMLHGGAPGDSRAGLAAAAGETDQQFLTLADKTGMLMVFPNGVGGGWNSCDSTAATGARVNDVAFIRAVVAKIDQTLPPDANGRKLDLSRVYVAGHSEGSKMAERLALEANDVVAAAAVMAGNNPTGDDHTGDANTFECDAGYKTQWAPHGAGGPAVPILLIKGDMDPRIPFGDPSTANPAHPDVTPDPNDYCQIKDYGKTGCPSGLQMSFYRTLAFWQWKLGLIDVNPARHADAVALSPNPPNGLRSQFPYPNTVATCADPNNTTPGCGKVPNPPVNTCANPLANAPTAAELRVADGSFVTRYTYGSPNYPLVFDRITGGGHGFPGPVYEGACEWYNSGWKNRDELNDPGTPLTDTYLAGRMYAFFQQFQRMGTPARR